MTGWETLFDGEPATPPTTAKPAGSSAKRSIRYLAEMVVQYGKVSSVGDLLDRVAAFRQYKPYNAMLVLLQRPGATYVLPAHEWEAKYGRNIRFDEQPLVMLQPRGPVMFLFDISQTEPGKRPRPLPPHLLNPYAMPDEAVAPRALDYLIENAKQDGVRVLSAGLGLGFAGCIRPTEAAVSQRVRPSTTQPLIEIPVRYDVALNRSYSPTEQLATLAHELGHLYCGHLGTVHSELLPGEDLAKDRSRLGHVWEELEAESVARVVFRRLAPAAELPPHLDQYFAEPPDLREFDLEPILTAAGRVLEMAAGPVRRRSRTPRAQPP